MNTNPLSIKGVGDSAGILLRAPEPADVDALYLLENDPRAWVDSATFAPVSRKQLWDYVNGYDGDIFAVGQLRLIIQSIENDETLGVIDLYDYDKIARRAYVGVIVKEQYRQHGVAEQALGLVIKYCREHIGMRQLAAVIRDGNIASEKLFLHHKFFVTGRFPEWIKTPSGYADALHLQLIITNT